MNKVRLLVSLFSGLALIAALVGCSAKTPEGPKTYKVFFNSQATASSFYLVINQGMYDANERYGFDIYIGGPSMPDTVKQVQMLDAAIASGEYDAFIIASAEPAQFVNSINRAVDAGKKVVCITDDVPNSKRHAFIGTSDVQAGETVGKYMAEITGGKATVNIQTVMAGGVSLQKRAEGFENAIKAYPNMKVHSKDSPTASSVAKQTEQLVARMIASPEIDALFNVGGDSGTVFASVYKDYKDRMNKMAIIGFDDLGPTVEGIKAGWLDATVIQSQYNWGFGAVYQLHRMLQKGLQPSATISYANTVVVNKSNVDTYYNDVRNPKQWLDFEAKEPK